MNKNSLIKNVLLFLIVFLLVSQIFKSCQPSEEKEAMLTQGDISVTTTKNEYSRTKTVIVEIQNNTPQNITFQNECPGEPFKVLHYENAEWAQIESSPELDCSEAKDIEILSGDSAKITFSSWNYALFSRMGRFKIAIDIPIATENPLTEESDKLTGEAAVVIKTFESNEFTVVEEGVFSKLWNGVLYRPIYNALIFLISIMPGYNLGLALLILTIIIRTILLAPNQKAMKAQRKMQDVQPMLEKVKEKYKGDQARISQETMLIWKTQKVNPLGGCLPMLLQFPVLIALFWVIKGGLNPDNAHLLYTSYGSFSYLDIETTFLGLDLLRNNLYVLPVIVGMLQFGQMKLAMARKGTKKKSSSEMAIANNMMIYLMPVMIAVFTATLPAAVGLYWGTSTLYGVIQQFFVNKSVSSPKKDEVSVKVIEHKNDPKDEKQNS